MYYNILAQDTWVYGIHALYTTGVIGNSNMETSIYIYIDLMGTLAMCDDVRHWTLSDTACLIHNIIKRFFPISRDIYLTGCTLYPHVHVEL